MPTVATVADVKKYLPAHPPDSIDDSDIDDALEGVHTYYAARIRPKVPSSDNEMDILVETLLAAVEIRDNIPGLDSADGSKTKALENRAEKMIDARVDSSSSGDDSNPLPVGPGGRNAVGKTIHEIFDIPRPDSDEYDGMTADDPHRPDVIS